MATPAAHKRLTREYAMLEANPTQYITAHPSETNILEWHYILTGPPSTPYEGGQYWGTLVFPSDYPFKPPAIRMHTPSGRFRCSERLCLSISDFHPKSFNPAWSVSTILLGVLSFMSSEEITTGSIVASEAERKVHAARTRWWNSTGGGSTSRAIAGQQQTQSNGRGFGAIKAGDGGKRFRAQWPELDEENWKWMEQNNIDPQTGKSVSLLAQSCSPETDAIRRTVAGSAAGLGAVVEGGREVRDVGQGFIRRNAWYLAIGMLFAYVIIARLLNDA
ncbi:ubiquitin-conjugating enzyme E2 6 [Neohortaea acidophila]|uniref:Ubiquitin-conjugating enzyme E2 6 n=1 Tax=Neohortaea acidophila TaxID=245834 RepID=A0A6A6Q824_9PEZI|nr:ubiquitin-conjugating enzyme E2 6 [Neohortaea acidophila]KAF2487527.1 ubiquitin-conjugating enzyme E2 6 [Neohortaea acidophila]